MYRLDLGLYQRPALRHRLKLEVIGGATDSIFGLAETLLLSHTDYQKALMWAVTKNIAKRYRSMMDCLFVEAFPEYFTHCMRFYKDGDEQVKNILTSEEIKDYDLMLCKLLAALVVLWNARNFYYMKPARAIVDLPDIVKSIRNVC